MKLGISWNCYRGLDDNAQIALMKENGFEATFFGGANPRLDELVALVKKEGILCENLHAPFSQINAIWEKEQSGDQMLFELISNIDKCAKHEIPVIVVHLSSGINPPRINDVGYERLLILMEHAKRQGVTVAFENLRRLDNLAFAMEQFPEAGFCWDTGHETCFTDGIQFMPLFGKRLCSLHIHDNKQEFNGDLHMIPYDGTMDFDYIAEQIAKTEYSGSVMLELLKGNSNAYDNFTPEEYYKHAAEAARKLEKAIASKRIV